MVNINGKKGKNGQGVVACKSKSQVTKRCSICL